MLKVLLLLLFPVAFCASPVDCRAVSPDRVASFGGSCGKGNSYSEAYAQAASGMPYGAVIYQRLVLRPASKDQKWNITLMWRKN